VAENFSVIEVGHLHDDLTAVAGRVLQELTHQRHLVWSNQTGAVFMARGDAHGDVPAHWIAGNFSIGQSISNIEDDLRLLLRERAKDSIIE
jgi:hypothetical protein